MKSLLALAAVLSLSVACAKSEPPPASPTTSGASTTNPAVQPGATATAEGHADKKDDHGAMKPAIHDFHEVMAPIWHTTAGAERVTKACAGDAELRAKAAAVGDSELTADVAAVHDACEKDKSTVEAKLSTVHDRFHKIAEAK